MATKVVKHFNPKKGRWEICRAKKGKCPMKGINGEAPIHSNNYEEQKRIFEDWGKKNYGLVSSLTSRNSDASHDMNDRIRKENEAFRRKLLNDPRLSDDDKEKLETASMNVVFQKARELSTKSLMNDLSRWCRIRGDYDKEDVDAMKAVIKDQYLHAGRKETYILYNKASHHKDLSRPTSSSVQVEEFDNGDVVFSKPLYGLSDDTLDEYLTTDIGTLRHEYTAYKLSRILGSPYKNMVPTTVIKSSGLKRFGNQLSVSSLKMKGVSGIDIFDHDFVVFANDFSKKQQRDISVFDSVIGNLDRNNGNLLFDENNNKKITALIDHAYSFPKMDLESSGDFEVGNDLFIEEKVPLSNKQCKGLKDIFDSPDLYGLSNFLTKGESDGVKWRIGRMLKDRKTLSEI